MDLRKAETLALQLMAQHGLCADPTWDFAKRNGWAGTNKAWSLKWDNAYRRFGVCKMSQRVIGLSKKLVAVNDEDEVRDTILHEIAHALAPRGAHHGAEWKAVCVKIGARPVACYSIDTVTSVAAKFQGTCPTCNKVYTRFKRPPSHRSYSCPCRPRGAGFGIPDYAIVFRKVDDVVIQARGDARTAAQPPVTPPPVGVLSTWFHGQYLPVELIQALREENVQTITAEQLAHIQRVQQERGISYKSAVQFIRRAAAKPNTPFGETPTPAETVDTTTAELVIPTGPITPEVVATVSAALADIPVAVAPDVPAPLAEIVAQAEFTPPATQGKWDAGIAAFMYAKGCKLIDIAEAMGYVRGKGQTRVRRALEVAGVWQGAH